MTAQTRAIPSLSVAFDVVSNAVEVPRSVTGSNTLPITGASPWITVPFPIE